MLLLSVSSRRDGRWRSELHRLCFGNGNTFSVFPLLFVFYIFYKIYFITLCACVCVREIERERCSHKLLHTFRGKMDVLVQLGLFVTSGRIIGFGGVDVWSENDKAAR